MNPLSDRKLVVVCGDSWMTPTYNSYIRPAIPNEKHFSQILTDKINWDLIFLSNVGFSNLGIIDQILTAIEIQPDLIIFNTTGFDRFEMCFNKPHHFDLIHEKYPIFKYIHHEYNYLRKILIPSYSYILPSYISSSVDLDVSLNYFLKIAETIDKTLVKKIKNEFSNIREDIVGYINLQDEILLDRYDKSIFFTLMNKLKTTDIPFICMLDCLDIGDCDVFNQSNYVLPYSEIVPDLEKYHEKMGLSIKTLPHFHTTQATQHEFADIILNVMEQRNLV